MKGQKLKDIILDLTSFPFITVPVIEYHSDIILWYIEKFKFD